MNPFIDENVKLEGDNECKIAPRRDTFINPQFADCSQSPMDLDFLELATMECT